MEKIINCKSCLMPSSRPRITYDEKQICNACNYQTKKNLINWEEREKEFIKICNKFRSKRYKINE